MIGPPRRPPLSRLSRLLSPCATLCTATLCATTLWAATLAAPATPAGTATTATTAASAAAATTITPAHTGYSAAALYNLANSYARSGKPGMAVLNYERARLLDPGDPDIRANLRVVRAKAGLPAEPARPLDRLPLHLPPTVLAWVGLTGWLLAGFGFLAAMRYSAHRHTLRAAALLGLLLTGFTVWNGVTVWPTLHAGVVVTPTADARVAPVPMGEPLFDLREAETVGMSAEHDGYVLVRTQAGRTGWVPGNSIAPVVPH